MFKGSGLAQLKVRPNATLARSPDRSPVRTATTERVVLGWRRFMLLALAAIFVGGTGALSLDFVFRRKA